MVKIMRPLVVGAAMLAATAAGSKAGCAVDGAKAVDELTDAAIFTWAASKRCGNPAHSQVRCEVDIASAVQSVVDLSTVIVEAVNDCGDVEAENADCGIAAAEVTSAAAGLAASAGGIAAACPNGLGQPTKGDGLGESTTFGKCVVDAKSSVGSLFKAMKKMSQVKKNCDEAGEDCSDNALHVVSALSDLGSHLAASVNDCSAYQGAGNANAECAQHVLGMVSNLHGLADASVKMADECHTDDSRLYLEGGVKRVSSGNSMTVALGAFLPISAVLSFVAGSRFAKRRAQQPSLVETELE